MRLSRRHLVWAAVAMLGIAAPAALTWSITRLTGQHIGLAAQPLSVIKGLAPARRDGQGYEEGLVRGRARTKPGRHRRSETRRLSGNSSDPSASVGTSSTTLSPILPAPTGSLPQAPASTSQTPAAGPGTRGRTSGGGDDSSGGGSSGPDD